MAAPEPALSSHQRERYLRAIGEFPRQRVLVVGDVMLDVFIWGEVSRISPEAPVPVVEVVRETHRLGGAANVAHNVAALGGQVALAGLVGADEGGRELSRELQRKGIDSLALIQDPQRPTIIKTRIIAQNQQVVRMDRELCLPIGKDHVGFILDWMAQRRDDTDALIVSDYGKGVVTRELMDGIRSLIEERASLPVVVDPVVAHRDFYEGTTIITPNNAEASAMAGIAITDEESLLEAGRRLLRQTSCREVLITRGKDGMTLFRKGHEAIHIPAMARQVYDVTGAGDTVVSTLALCMAVGLTTEEAAKLANLAASIAVGRVGTAAVGAPTLTKVVKEPWPATS